MKLYKLWRIFHSSRSFRMKGEKKCFLYSYVTLAFNVSNYNERFNNIAHEQNKTMQSTQHRTNSVVKWYNFVKPNENLLTNWWPFFVRWMLIILVGFIYSYVENCMELCEWIAWNVAMILRTNDKNWFLFDCCTLFYQIFFFLVCLNSYEKSAIQIHEPSCLRIQ